MAKIITCIVTHTDGVTKVKAKGILKDGVFDGSYKYLGMSYGIEIAEKKIKIIG